MNLFLKLVLSLSVILYYVSALEIQADEELECLQSCSLEYNSTLNLTNFIENARIPNEEDHDAKCLFHCVPEKLGLTDNEGYFELKIISEYMRSKYPSIKNYQIKIVTRRCLNTDITDRCNRWYDFSKCAWKMFLDNGGRECLGLSPPNS